jgi:hypothetical protein
MATKDDQCRKANLLVAIETTQASIYSRLTLICPQKWQVWHHLARVEENHAMAAMLAELHCEAGELPEGFLSRSIADMEETLASARELKAEVVNRKLSIEEALARTLSLEEAACTAYFREMAEEPASGALLKIRRLVNDTDAHLKLLKEFISHKKYLDCADVDKE